jgi:hypothetical protein
MIVCQNYTKLQMAPGGFACQFAFPVMQQPKTSETSSIKFNPHDDKQSN